MPLIQKKKVKIGNETKMGVHVYEWVKNCTDLEKSFYHFANEGKRGFMNADLLKRMGFKAGVLDCFFSRPNKQYSGLWIELKDTGKKPTKEQAEFITQMLKDGYYATWTDDINVVFSTVRWFYDLTDEIQVSS